MSKKLYNSPVAKFHKLKTSRILAGSDSIDAQMIDEEVTEADTQEKVEMKWGVQW